MPSFDPSVYSLSKDSDVVTFQEVTTNKTTCYVKYQHKINKTWSITKKNRETPIFMFYSKCYEYKTWSITKKNRETPIFMFYSKCYEYIFQVYRYPVYSNTLLKPRQKKKDSHLGAVF
jgi:hypothetical protein